MEHSRRVTEGMLLLFASLILLAGFALVFAAKLPELRTAGTTNINSASASQLASALSIDDDLAKLIVEHRQSHGPFPSTSALADVPLLSESQVKTLMDLNSSSDITGLSPGQLSTRANLSSGVARRLVDILAVKKGRITQRYLAGRTVVDSDAVQAVDSYLRVRDPGGVVFGFWLYAALIVLGFFGLHLFICNRAPLADAFLLPCVLLLAGVGAVMLFSIKNPLRDTLVYPLQAQGILIGLVVSVLPFTARFKTFRPWRYTYLFAIAAVFFTLLLAVLGSGPGGAHLKIFGFQPVEVIKILLAFFVAGYLAERWSLLGDHSGPKRTFQLPLFKDIGPLLVMYLVSLSTFILVKDLGPMLVLFGMFVALLYAATGKRTFIGVGIVMVGLSGLTAYLLKLGVFSVRVDMWLHPWANSHPNGMQLGQSLWGFGTGGIWGSGLGLGRPDLMSRSGSDLIFASIGEELGLIGSLAILILFAIVITRSCRIALHARRDFDRFLAVGITALLGIQTTVILFGVVGILPLTGVSLPFASYGKSSLIASFFLLGLLMNISADGVKESATISNESRGAIKWLATGLTVLLIVVVGVCRLVWIQGVHGDEYAGYTVNTPDADGFVRPHINPRLRAIEAGIPRGTIYDRNGIPLATSRADELAQLGLSAKAKNRPSGRYYPGGDAFSHLVGYLDPKCGGPVGMEKWRNEDLRGFDSYSELIPLYRHSHTPYAPKLQGRDIRLTIDAGLQNTVRQALEKYAGAIRDKKTGGRKHRAAAVVIDVYTGEVLAAVSIPGFDPNDLTPGQWKSYNRDQKHEAVLMDRSINGIYPPGSTFKLITASAALENGTNLTYNCRHTDKTIRWRYDGKRYTRKDTTDSEEMRPHGVTDLAKAVRYSCNIFFAHLGVELGPDKLYEAARRFGFSRLAPPKKLAENLPDDSYGQGIIEVTPLEMARAVAAIANGGVMMKPHFIKEVRQGDKVIKTIAPVKMGTPLSPENAASLRKMMADVVTNGTARGVFSGLKYSVAGKTGSAENEQGDKMAHSWFVGFTPVEDPRIAFAVVVENGGYGRGAAGSVCREIVKKALK